MASSTKKMWITWAILGASAVGLGAFGAHGLKAVLSPDRLAIYETGIRYQFYHLVLLAVCAWGYEQRQRAGFAQAFWLAVVGVLFFSGSLYLLACRDLMGITQVGILGPITPIGGLLLIVAWLMAGWAFAKKD